MGIKCPKCQHENPEDLSFCGKCGTQLPPPEKVEVTETLETPKEELTTGSTFAERYQIIEELGKGGMGKVYKVHDTEIREKVALKLLKSEIAADEKTIERFRNEIKLARKIAHRNVCKMYDLGEEKGTRFITMEYVDGEDLKSMIRMVGQLSSGKAISIAKQVCEGLAEAHSLGVVHRDLKPSNIMIDKFGNAKIMDFGIARSLKAKGITGTGVMIGTPEYMSPEQVEGKEIDQRTDIYSVGVILYEVVTGQLPFEGETAFSVAMKHKSEKPEDPRKFNSQIPEDLGRLILKCLEKDKENRYQSAEELRSELTRIEEGIPTTERVEPKRKPITAREITLKFSLKKLLIPVLIVVALAILISISVIFINRQPSGKPVLPEYKQFTYTGNASHPAISPDGKFIAYVTRETFDDKKVLVQDIVTGQTLEVFRVKDCRYLRWTPDSSELSFWAEMKDSSSGIFIVPQLGGTPRRLGEGVFHAWSPDGSQFASCNEDSKEIQITNKKTGDSASLPLKGSFSIDAIDWSPNGNFLLFLAFYESHRCAIWTISTDGSEQHKVIEEDTDLISPRWAPRGDAIYYFKYVPPSEEQLWKIPVSKDTGKSLKSPSLLIGGLEGVGLHFTITGDGKRLLHTRKLMYTNLWLVTVEGCGKGQAVKTNQLTTGLLFNLCPNISPDGKLIAFSRGMGEPFNIFVMPLEGGSPKQITFLDSLNFYPAWSPDGNEIAFSSNRGGANTIWKVSVRGGNPHQFVKSKLDDVYTSFAWSPGSNILYPISEGRNLSILYPDSEDETALAEEDLDIRMHFPEYSPDGKRVAVYGARNSNFGLWIISFEDYSHVFLRKGRLIPLRWSSDGKWIYVSEQMQGAIKILKVALENGETQTVFALPFTLEKGNPYYHQVTMTPDARHFVIPTTKSQSDIWMVENFDSNIN